ncbi:hypothetical protein NPX13_g6047 [Xylaria arbuscula]|uniref:Uncharacterized protein n=1 Tax=Xylaria arbuscula TaxID=114810 RepID=A0A9W8TMI7_9PEZI|nr:hypothetical protein NPX13_g6047 [Xylaria arbuscula]
MSSYKARRLENIKRNESLVNGLGLRGVLAVESATVTREPTSKRRKLSTPRPTRASARIANAPSKPSYTDDGVGDASFTRRQSRRARPPSQQQKTETPSRAVRESLISPSPELQPQEDLEALKAKWSSWTPSAGPPTRDDEGNYHFDSHPIFTPNKSPEAIIREGSFGGSYWRPLYSRHLRTTISGDWQELPASWTEGLSVERYLTSPTYDPEVNKYGVACGQSIEEWEAAGVCYPWCLFLSPETLRGYRPPFGTKHVLGAHRCSSSLLTVNLKSKMLTIVIHSGLPMDTMFAAGSNGIVVFGWADGVKMMNARLTGGESVLVKPVDGEEYVRPPLSSPSSQTKPSKHVIMQLKPVLKKYIQSGVRTVTDEDDEVGEKKDVSPVVHQVGHNPDSQDEYQPSQLISHYRHAITGRGK